MISFFMKNPYHDLIKFRAEKTGDSLLVESMALTLGTKI